MRGLAPCQEADEWQAKIRLLPLRRYPTLPVAELQRHQAPVNALAWAPHSSCHICSAGDDAQALIWDLSTMSHPMDHGLGAAHCPISPKRMPPCLHLLCAPVTAANGCLWLQLRVCAVRLLHVVRVAASTCVCLTQLALSMAKCTPGCLALVQRLQQLC